MMYLIAACFEAEITWFLQVCELRFKSYFQDNQTDLLLEPHCPVPDLIRSETPYAKLVRQYQMGFNERFILMLALMPHLKPHGLDLLLVHNSNLGRPFSEVGGWRGKVHGGFLPTCETAVFLLAGENLELRLSLMDLFKEQHYFSRQGILKFDHQGDGEPFLGSTLTVRQDQFQYLCSGEAYKPDFSSNFPAKLLETQLQWKDLILNPEVMDEIDNILTWLNDSKEILQEWDLSRKLKPGYRCLFYGPPGTGKTLTASLIGAEVKRSVYRIDLSMIVSKYIGETEKNLAHVFDQAENKQWILFFDEADALFGKRTQTSSSNDRHANQEISYLLQRVEDFPGVVILATNLKANIDAAFSRRFQSEVYFAMPDSAQRLRLWDKLFPQKENLSSDVNLKKLADQYEIAGGALLNVARFAAIRAKREKRKFITQSDLISGLGRELMKDGKSL
jgi:hypothetical protein